MNDAVLPQRAMHLTFGTWGPDAAGTATVCVYSHHVHVVMCVRLCLRLCVYGEVEASCVCNVCGYVHVHGMYVANNTSTYAVDAVGSMERCGTQGARSTSNAVKCAVKSGPRKAASVRARRSSVGLAVGGAGAAGGRVALAAVAKTSQVCVLLSVRLFCGIVAFDVCVCVCVCVLGLGCFFGGGSAGCGFRIRGHEALTTRRRRCFCRSCMMRRARWSLCMRSGECEHCAHVHTRAHAHTYVCTSARKPGSFVMIGH